MHRSRRRPAATSGNTSAGPEFERRIQEAATLDDLDLELAGAFLMPAPVGNRPVVDSMLHYGLIRREGDEWKITNAALLLFCRREPQRWHPRAGLRVRRVAGTQTMIGRSQNVTTVGHTDPPLAVAVKEGLRVVGEQIRRSESLRDIFFRDMPEYPDLAWREVVVNTVAHRDYEIQSHGTDARDAAGGDVWRDRRENGALAVVRVDGRRRYDGEFGRRRNDGASEIAALRAQFALVGVGCDCVEEQRRGESAHEDCRSGEPVQPAVGSGPIRGFGHVRFEMKC